MRRLTDDNEHLLVLVAMDARDSLQQLVRRIDQAGNNATILMREIRDVAQVQARRLRVVLRHRPGR